MVAGPVFWRNISHDEVYKAVIRGYNDWLGEEYCAVAPDRLIGMGVIPITNVDDAIAEMKHCKKLGLKGVLLGALAQRQGLSDAGGRQILGRRARPRHAGHRARPALPHRRARQRSRPSNIPKEDPVIMQRLRRPFLEWLCNFGLPPSVGMAQLVLAGRVRALPEAQGVLRRDPARLGPVLARAHGSVVPAPSRLGARNISASSR